MIPIMIVTGVLALITYLIAKKAGASKGVSEIDDLDYFLDEFDNYNDLENDSPKNRHKGDDAI